MSQRDPPAAVAPVSGQRPRVSVMIPAYRPGPYLKATLQSILAQDLGPAAMQIAVIDDASPDVDLRSLLVDSHSGRIELHRNSNNLGLAGNWNRAIELARGEFVHLLHQDDLVLPGFYTRLLAGLGQSPAGMAFCRHDFIDADGVRTRRSHRERWRAGLLRNWLTRIAEKQRIQCPAVLVRRSAYEALGGFRTDLAYALDWEMWVRIAARFPVWYEPRTLACYRRHGNSETSRLTAAGIADTDVLETIETFAPHLPAATCQQLTARAYRRALQSHLKLANKSLDAGNPAAAMGHIDIARKASERLPTTSCWDRMKLQRIASRIPASFPSA